MASKKRRQKFRLRLSFTDRVGVSDVPRSVLVKLGGGGVTPPVVPPPTGTTPLLIHHGMDITSAAYIQTNAATLDLLPFDGLTFQMGSSLSFQTQTQTPVSFAQYQSALAPVVTAQQTMTRLKHNWVMVYSTPAGDLFSDWTIPINNYRNLAQACAAAGIEGIFFDIEEYQGAALTYPDNAAGKTVGEAQTQARLRGKQIMDAMRAVWPGVRILSTYGAWLSETLTYTTMVNAGIKYNDVAWANQLRGPFVVGLAEGAAGTAATVIDGGEIYTLRTPAHFQVMYDWEKTGFPAQSSLVPSALKSTYASNLSASFGIYDTPWQGETMDLAIWEPTITNAMRRADRYVWAYVEQYDWLGGGWPTTPVPQAWKDATTRARAAAQTPVTTVYGPAFNLDALQNIVVGGSLSRKCSHRFRSPTTSTITSVNVWMKNGGTGDPGYGLGNGGTITATIESDNGSGLPSGIALGAAVSVQGAAVNVPLFATMTFPTPINVTAGTVYHVVYRNVAADPVANYCSVNNTMMMSAVDPYQPRFPDNSFTTLKQDGTGAWARFVESTPMVDVTFGNGSHYGNAYLGYRYGQRFYGSIMLRERFTVSAANRTVTGVAFRCCKPTGGAGTAPLIARLEQSDGTLIESVSISTDSLPYENDAANGRSGAWLSGAFTQSRTLTVGATYNVRFSVDASTVLWTRPIEHGANPSYKFHSSGEFPDGSAQYSSNSGSSWSVLPSMDADADLQMYLTVT